MKRIENFNRRVSGGSNNEISIKMTNDKAELQSSHKTNLPRQKFLYMLLTLAQLT